ncbi:CPBP family intramembrane glutamic endopeptidase [Nocardia asteroides]|uniref:CPBP family intramembrane glutamic endopeptidase n=1 Tax=Nocardia asteroides TaxID=1824 RepID=UPI001E2C32E9|nr:CPBP family intramembrane glutamic endopeptidase [Nocardia asteroides]UGT58046.1 CPBP family intramembrane metalloprotease [Nocardia asteroides]
MSERADDAAVAAAGSGDRFGKLIERDDSADFPYYAGDPVALSAGQWVLAWAAVAVGFAALVLIPASDNIAMLVPRILFVTIPLVVLGWVSRNHWQALFRRVTGRDVGLMVGFAVLNLLVTVVLAFVVNALFGSATNPAAEDAGKGGAVDTVAFFVGTGFQLVGEEVFTVIPFLAVLYFAVAKAGLSRRNAILLAWLVSSLWFAAAHLPTYDWNFAQAFLVIGGARIILTLAYIRTKNLAVSAGAHIINDWTLFGQAVATNAALALF